MRESEREREREREREKEKEDIKYGSPVSFRKNTHSLPFFGGLGWSEKSQWPLQTRHSGPCILRRKAPGKQLEEKDC